MNAEKKEFLKARFRFCLAQSKRYARKRHVWGAEKWRKKATGFLRELEKDDKNARFDL